MRCAGLSLDDQRSSSFTGISNVELEREEVLRKVQCELKLFHKERKREGQEQLREQVELELLQQKVGQVLKERKREHEERQRELKLLRKERKREQKERQREHEELELLREGRKREQMNRQRELEKEEERRHEEQILRDAEQRDIDELKSFIIPKKSERTATPMASSTSSKTMATSDKAIGIDLGTAFSCVGVWHNDRVEIIPNDHGNRTTPSYVTFTDTERLIGDTAKNQVAMNPQNSVFNPETCSSSLPPRDRPRTTERIEPDQKSPTMFQSLFRVFPTEKNSKETAITMATSNKAIGIDLVTTYSCVGVWQNNRVEIIPNDHGNRNTPSFAFTDTERLVGHAAKNQAAMNPKNTVFEVERLIGRGFSADQEKKKT
ncbi:hypothetical protein Vadar_007242 [Vaccinium darrowii]|uniref:Uncharacterized protein n=1 Tax=Vaccinium darrowii TaxID=229202 RepID=A0ACB7Z2I0_9ERIC|nr:hypothetical protein Vadar_007242 [Vaccinium darrowii]